MKLLLTGGHLAPALAVIDELKSEQYKNIQIVFVGRKDPSLEFEEVTKRSIPFIHLDAGRMSRFISIESIKGLFKAPFGFIQAFQIVKKERPDRILTFGSYIGLPIALAGFLLHIPTYTHEQTIHPGLANRIISRFAKKIYISFPESKTFFNPKKTILTGNPLRKEVTMIIKKPFSFNNVLPVIYITGGSLGSHNLNNRVYLILQDILKIANVIHQTGNVEKYKDYERFSSLQKQLPPSIRDRYIVRKHIYSDEIGYVYSMATVVVGRAGANTISELIALQKPAVLVPLPWSAHQEQQKQAHILVSNGTAELYTESEESDKLYDAIYKVLKHTSEYRHHYKNLETYNREHATETILKDVLS